MQAKFPGSTRPKHSESRRFPDDPPQQGRPNFTEAFRGARLAQPIRSDEPSRQVRGGQTFIKASYCLRLDGLIVEPLSAPTLRHSGIETDDRQPLGNRFVTEVGM